LPLSGAEVFVAKLQRHNRLVLPKVVRWKHKIEAGELLRVSIELVESAFSREVFLAKVTVDGRITVPKLHLAIFRAISAKECCWPRF